MAFAARPLVRRLSILFQVRQYSAPAERSIPSAKLKYVPTAGEYPKGFLAGSAFAGVKASNTRYNDLALIVSEEPCAASAVFTKNIFKAAPVVVSKKWLEMRKYQGFRGVIINSGCANAVTGKLGHEHAEIMARETDNCFSSDKTSGGEVPTTLVMSTGVIGQRLPIDRITGAIPSLHSALGPSHDHWLAASQAICTTDTFPKLLSRTYTLPSHPDTSYSITGMSKGAGMIAPNMGTLLGVICTDAKIDPSSLHGFLSHAAAKSFNCISIDGDTSTNDAVALFANGAAAPDGIAPVKLSPSQAGVISSSDNDLGSASEDAQAFSQVLTAFMTDLAKLVVRDGEGATKFVTIRVRSDVSYVTAKRAAASIATSSLVKTALYGKDANWGRILCAIGYAPGIMDKLELPTEDVSTNHQQVVPSRTSVSFVPSDGSDELKLLVRGEPEEVDEARAKQILEMEDLEILVRLEDDAEPLASGSNQSEAVFWTCDFSHEYVTINGDYRT